MITLTQAAMNQLVFLSDETDGNETVKVRVKVLGGGCAGFQYDMYLEDHNFKVGELDEVFTTERVSVIIDQLSHQYLNGTMIDYVNDGFQEGFKFSNPNVSKTCGCGNSFS